MPSPTAAAKIARNAETLDDVIDQGRRLAGLFAAGAEAALESEDGEARAGRLMASWGRITRRTMQAIVLDDRLDRSAARERRREEAEVDAWRPADVRQRRAEILAAFRVDPLDGSDDLALKELLTTLAEDGVLARLSTLETVRRAAEALNLPPPRGVAKEAEALLALRPAPAGPAAGEAAAKPTAGVTPNVEAASDAATPQGTPSVAVGDSSPQGGAMTPSATPAAGRADSAPTGPATDALHPSGVTWLQYERAKRQRAERERRECIARGEDPDSS
jgi:hypothetical protein